MSTLRLHRNKSAWTYPATLVKYARNAVPDSMIGSYTCMTRISPQTPDARTPKSETHVPDDDPGNEEEEVKVREQQAARGPALARDPEREEAEEAGRV